LKPEALRGLSDLEDYVKHEDLTVINGLKEMPPKTGVRVVEDENHYRTGWLLSPEMEKQMLEEAMNGKQLVHKTQVDRKVCLTMEMLNHQMDVYKGLLMMAYPGYHGLGEYEPVRLLLEDKANWSNNGDMNEFLNEADASLWACNKELTVNKKFSDFFGKNEK
jgi:cilia- and flagella-associated protein 298